MCEPVYEGLIPDLKSFNVSNKAFVQTFLGKGLNLSQVAYTKTDVRMPNMPGEYCSNTTHQWILLTIYPEGNTMSLFLFKEVFSKIILY